MKLLVILEQASHNWCAYTPDEIGVVVATGKTRDDAIKQFRTALRSHLEIMQAAGKQTPTITELDIRETLPLQVA